jgi:S-adenosylmethionine synthetase
MRLAVLKRAFEERHEHDAKDNVKEEAHKGHVATGRDRLKQSVDHNLHTVKVTRLIISHEATENICRGELEKHVLNGVIPPVMTRNLESSPLLLRFVCRVYL